MHDPEVLAFRVSMPWPGRRHGHELVNVCNPADNGGSTNESWEYYMRLGIRMLLDCDEMVLLPGWEASRGAKLELRIAQHLGMRITEWHSGETLSVTTHVVRLASNIVGISATPKGAERIRIAEATRVADSIHGGHQPGHANWDKEYTSYHQAITVTPLELQDAD